MKLCNLSRLSYGGKKPCCNQSQDLLFPCRDRTVICSCNIHRRDNGMVVTYFLSVDDLLHIHLQNFRETILLTHLLRKLCRALFHFICQIPAVRSRISRQLFLIQALGVIKCLLRCEAIVFIGVSLQRSQVIQERRLFLFGIRIHVRNRSGLCCLHFPYQFLCRLLFFHAVRSQRNASCGDLHCVKSFRFEACNLCFPCDQHGKCRCHDSADIQCLTIKG